MNALIVHFCKVILYVFQLMILFLMSQWLIVVILRTLNMEEYHIQTAPTALLQPTPAMLAIPWLEIMTENVCQVEFGPVSPLFV